MALFTVVLDACVLYPAPMRDLFMELATTGLFKAHWSDQIHEEWIGALLKNRTDISADTLNECRRLSRCNP